MVPSLGKGQKGFRKGSVDVSCGQNYELSNGIISRFEEVEEVTGRLDVESVVFILNFFSNG